MVARLVTTETPLKLTQENHPENESIAAEEVQPKASLAFTVGLGVLCGLVGMTVGSAALSTAFQSDSRWEVLTLIPLVATLVSILGGWIGAFCHMILSEASKKER